MTNELREIAEAADNGPWRVRDDVVQYATWISAENDEADLCCVGEGWGYDDQPQAESIARHIATFDPPTVLRLLADLEAAEARVKDWWKPDPEDPFWMLESSDGEWLKNAHSMLGTRDPAKALRFPTERDANQHPAKMTPGYKWWAAKATEHTWIARTALAKPTEEARP